MPLTDTHCHLQDPRLAGDLEGVLARAAAAGVDGLVVCATREEDWPEVLALAARPGVAPLLGLHPWHLGDARPGWPERLAAALEASGAGVGECGLDGALEGADPGAQDAAFRVHLRLARDLDRPLSVHCRRAWGRLVDLVRAEGLPAAGAVVHAFGGSAETARDLQTLGFCLGFGCGLGDPARTRTAQVLAAVAPDRLLFETDAPDQPPRHRPGWDPSAPNEPAELAGVVADAARLLGLAPEVLAERAGANARRIFGRWLP